MPRKPRFHVAGIPVHVVQRGNSRQAVFRYRALGGSEAERQQVYRGQFRVHVDVGQLKQIRDAWQTGTPLGIHRFKEQVETMLGRKVGQARRGRPKKESIEVH